MDQIRPRVASHAALSRLFWLVEMLCTTFVTGSLGLTFSALNCAPLRVFVPLENRRSGSDCLPNSFFSFLVPPASGGRGNKFLDQCLFHNLVRCVDFSVSCSYSRTVACRVLIVSFGASRIFLRGASSSLQEPSQGRNGQASKAQSLKAKPNKRFGKSTSYFSRGPRTFAINAGTCPARSR